MVQRYIIINKKMKIKVVLIKKNNRRKIYVRKLWKVGRSMPQICQINDISQRENTAFHLRKFYDLGWHCCFLV